MRENYYSRVGERRRELGVSEGALALVCGIPIQELRNIEAGIGPEPRLNVLLRLTRHLGRPLGDLFDNLNPNGPIWQARESEILLDCGCLCQTIRSGHVTTSTIVLCDANDPSHLLDTIGIDVTPKAST